jgi:hypothetical protein
MERDRKLVEKEEAKQGEYEVRQCVSGEGEVCARGERESASFFLPGTRSLFPL